MSCYKNETVSRKASAEILKNNAGQVRRQGIGNICSRQAKSIAQAKSAQGRAIVSSPGFTGLAA
ncbi:MAG: hypothetical protein ACXVJE_01980 [Mucilaginibacter sp.]